MTAALKLTDVSISFGGIRALDKVSLSVPKGQMRGLIGPNGSGKTTMLNVMSRVYSVDSGIIEILEMI